MSKLYRSTLAICICVSTVFAFQGIHDQKLEELQPGEHILWQDPGDVASRDLFYGVGGKESQPEPPFRFVKEDMSGTVAKVDVIDNRGASWNVKWGREAHASAFCTRLLWACGYFAEPEYFVASGRIEGAQGLKRARSHMSDSGSFEDARFQLRRDSPKYLNSHHWAWTNNPFLSTRELQGLKVMVLLVSNWDTKDARNSDSNLAIFEDESSGQPRYFYADVDWGAALGRWGHTLSWSKWDCKGFAEQTENFVKMDDGQLDWGFKGKHRKDITDDISLDDVQWLLQYLNQISDEQIQGGLEGSGATPEETSCYMRALRHRIEQLQQVVRR